MSINQSYTREIRENLNYTATWFPNRLLTLGDVGFLRNYEFTYHTNLANLGIDFQGDLPGPPGTFSHISSTGVTRSIKLEGQAPLPGSALGQADGGLVFTFQEKDAVVFLSNSCKITSIVDQEQLRRDILERYRNNDWDPNFVVVSEVVLAGNTTVIVSEGNQGRYELRAKAGLQPSFESMNVAGNFLLAHDSQIGYHFLAEANLTPLFRCVGVRRGLFRTDVVTRGEGVESAPSAIPSTADKTLITVDELEYDDFAAGK